jgi:DNA-binding GntR family transcriptional regulator
MENKGMDFSQTIYKDIRSKILSGKLKKGDRLVETSIAKQYGASRLHVKSAFRLLETEQLVEHIRNKGVAVLGVPSETIEEISLIRQALEGVIIKKVIMCASDENIAEMKRMAKRLGVFTENYMLEDAHEELGRFYNYLYELSGYTRITGILNLYSDYISLIRHLTGTEVEHRNEGVQNMNSLVDAIENRDVDKAVEQVSLRHKYLSLEKLETAITRD